MQIAELDIIKTSKEHLERENEKCRLRLKEVENAFNEVTSLFFSLISQ